MSGGKDENNKDHNDRLSLFKKYVAQPIITSSKSHEEFSDPYPALLTSSSDTINKDTGILIGNKYHAADIKYLQECGVTAVLNCASGGISRLPVDELKEKGIRYAFTNVRQDNPTYPILFPHGCPQTCSQHLRVAMTLYQEVVLGKERGKILFFCVAGQNRSAALALAVLLLYGYELEDLLQSCSLTRPFIMENTGFQKQVVEFEAYLQQNCARKISTIVQQQCKRNSISDTEKSIISRQIVYYEYANMDESTFDLQHQAKEEASPALSPNMSIDSAEGHEPFEIEIELLIPGLCTMDVKIPAVSTIAKVKTCLVEYANQHLLAVEDCSVAKSWVVLAMFGYDSMYDFPLEKEAIDIEIQIKRMQEMFDLHVSGSGKVQWNEKCRFALVIFSVYRESWSNSIDKGQKQTLRQIQEPWTFCHEERPGAPATLLENTLQSTHLRAWDFVTGQAFCSKQPIVFSFTHNALDKRQFMKISTSANEAQQFHAPGEGGILGMGANAIVHRVELKSTSPSLSSNYKKKKRSRDHDQDLSSEATTEWDSAVKRPFSLSKMLASLENKSEAGLAKRVRFANSLNSDGRILYFYGLGVALSANANNTQEYKFEAVLLARYEEEFSTYTMKKFMQDYTCALPQKTPHWQKDFSIIQVKVLLVSLLNAFRDLTLMGVQAFDFNHLNNVLVSRDHQTVKLLDIDGNSKGSIQFPSEYIQGDPNKPCHGRRRSVHKPSLDIDLNTILPTVIQQLLLGKGRGTSFVENKKSQIWRAKTEEDGKKHIQEVISQNFGLQNSKSLAKIAEWFYAVIKKQSPWENWTHDIYDAMRCIDHLPIA